MNWRTVVITLALLLLGASTAAATQGAPRSVEVRVLPRLEFRAGVGLTEMRIDGHLHIGTGVEGEVGGTRIGLIVGNDYVRMQSSITDGPMRMTLSDELPYRNLGRDHDTRVFLHYSFDPTRPGRFLDMGMRATTVPMWGMTDQTGRVRTGIVKQEFCRVSHEVGPVFAIIEVEQPSRISLSLHRSW